MKYPNRENTPKNAADTDGKRSMWGLAVGTLGLKLNENTVWVSLP